MVIDFEANLLIGFLVNWKLLGPYKDLFNRYYLRLY